MHVLFAKFGYTFLFLTKGGWVLVIHGNGTESFGHFGLGGDVIWISSDGDNPMKAK